MQIFREIAGYSFGHADVVRRAISKKKQGVLESERQAFIDGAVSQGINENEAIKLFEDIVSFANYAFNKSHAAAYAVLSFRTAYLKTHYPREYESALLTSVLSSTEKLAEYIADCSKQGIKILPPDINKSRGSFHVEGDSIRFGLTALKSVGSNFIENIIAERNRDGKFTDINDFMLRTRKIDMNKRQLEVLIKSGSLDSLGTPRSQLLAVYESMIEKRGTFTREVFEGQIGLFDTASMVDSPKPARYEFPQIPEFTTREKLSLEKESCGLYLTGHILDDYKLHIAKINPTKIADIRASFKNDDDLNEKEDDIQKAQEIVLNFADKSRVTVAGSITKRVNKATKNGDQMAFVTIEDHSSSIEMLCFPKIVSKYGHLLTYDSVVAVRGILSVREDEDVKLLAESIIPLLPDSEAEKSGAIENVSEKFYDRRDYQNQKTESRQMTAQKYTSNTIRKVYLRVESENSSTYRRAKAICEIFDGNIPAIFYSSERKEYLTPSVQVNLTKFVLDELKEVLGSENVVVK